MPDDNLTDAQKEAYAVASVDEVTLETIEITHPVAGSVYLVRDQQEFTATLETAATVTFEPVAFRMGRPSQGESGAQEITVSIDNVNKRITDYIDTVRTSQQETEIKRRIFLASDTSQPQMTTPEVLTVSEVNVTLTEVAIVATFVDINNRAFPNARYTRKQFPSLGD